jgi:hypothetical protein
MGDFGVKWFVIQLEKFLKILVTGAGRGGEIRNQPVFSFEPVRLFPNLPALGYVRIDEMSQDRWAQIRELPPLMMEIRIFPTIRRLRLCAHNRGAPWLPLAAAAWVRFGKRGIRG